MPPERDPNSLTSQIRKVFDDRPDEELTIDDVAAVIGDDRARVARNINNVVTTGYIDRVATGTFRLASQNRRNDSAATVGVDVEDVEDVEDSAETLVYAGKFDGQLIFRDPENDQLYAAYPVTVKVEAS